MNKKQAIKKTRICETLVYSRVEDIATLIDLHSQLGMDEMEVFIDKKQLNKMQKVLDKKKFYSRAIEFESLQNECRLYVSWMSEF
jgi:hypothetical protein